MDVMNTGLVSLTDLGEWSARAFKDLGWYAGIMLWQYRNDLSGAGILSASGPLVAAYKAAGLPILAPQMSLTQMSAPQISQNTK